MSRSGQRKKRGPVFPAETASRATETVFPRGGGQRGWRFALLFGGLLAGYFLCAMRLEMPGPDYAEKHPLVARLVAVNEAAQRRVFVPYQRMIAAGTSATLNLLGYATTVADREVRSARFAVKVTNGCDGIELSLLLLAAVVAFPSSLRRKLAGLLLGLGLVAALNFLRVVTLWLIGAHWPRGFDFVHFNLWPLLLIVGTLAFYLTWLRRGAPEMSAKPAGP
jgi:exosortase H (IPTLxxWG-CTERM-specific)